MKKQNLLLLLFGLLLLTAIVSCNSSSEQGNEAGAETEIKPVPNAEYVGRYTIKESSAGLFFDVYEEGDSLYLHSMDIGNSSMHPEKNEVFDVPGHESKMRFLRDDAGQIDRVVLLTKKGRYTGVKVDPDSVDVVMERLKMKADSITLSKQE